MSKLKMLLVSACVALFATVAIAGGIQSVTLDVKGMTCASCPLTVKQVLKKVPGVTEVSVDLKSESALVKFDSEKTKPEQLAKAVSDVGFPTTLKR
jgi:periplasmic mercuric ion binding protein